MGKIGSLLLFLLIGIATYMTFLHQHLTVENKELQLNNEKTIVSNEQILDVKANSITQKILQENGFHTFIGQPVEKLQETYGEPMRVDLSAYDYEWWIYSDILEGGYFQVGVEDGKIVTLFIIGANSLATAPFELGMSYDQISLNYDFKDQVSFNVRNNSYQFNLSQEELETRPLLYIDGIFVQLYFDVFTNELSSIRYLDPVTIVKHRPYSIIYRGSLVDSKPLTETQWREIEIGSALQIFSITNEIRKKYSLQVLHWDEETAKVAYYHSEDMHTNNYFSHTSPNYGELKDRLKSEGIIYQLAGENIAAKYVDAIEAVEGWLNSEGHRVNLLHEDFTHLGVGVYERYYTQNFITPWE